MHETAYAKLNLALHVRAREPDGYHRIETIFAFCEDGDHLSVARDDRLLLTVEGPFADALDSSDNLVMRAARALKNHYGVAAGASLTLDKQLPVAAGLGGGSADAAAALRLLTRWWHLPDEPDMLHAIARGLGADVPACLTSRLTRGEGRGDDLRPVDPPRPLPPHVLLVNPRVAMATGPVFALWDGVDHGPIGDKWPGRNDLLAPAVQLAPVIGDMLDALSAADFAGLSGSGATCFALFDDLDRCAQVATAIRQERPDWWLRQTRLK